MRRYTHLADVQALVGQEIGCSDWIAVDQARIDLFSQNDAAHK